MWIAIVVIVILCVLLIWSLVTKTMWKAIAIAMKYYFEEKHGRAPRDYDLKPYIDRAAHDALTTGKSSRF